MPRRPPLLAFGRVLKPHGLKGLLKVKPHVTDSESLLQVAHVWLELGDQYTRRAVRTVRRDRRWFLLEIEDCHDRTSAERWRGAEVFVSRDELPALAEDEFYLADCLHKEAQLEDGTTLGLVAGILPTAGQDLLVVVSPREEILVPARPPFLLDVTQDCVILADSARMLPRTKRE